MSSIAQETSPDAGGPPLGGLAVGITSLIGSGGEILLLVLPTYLAAMGRTAALSESELGVLASVASGGLLLGTLLSALALSRVSARSIARAMLLVSAAADIALMFLHAFEPILVATGLCAVAGGLVYGAIYAVLSRQADAARAFAVFVALQLVFNFALLFAAPHLMALAGGPRGLLGLLAACGIALAALAGFVPDARIAGTATAAGARWHSVPVLAALGGFFLFAVGMGATWAYIEVIAHGRGFASEAVEHILSYGQLAALAGALAAMRVARDRVSPLMLLVGVGVSARRRLCDFPGREPAGIRDGLPDHRRGVEFRAAVAIRHDRLSRSQRPRRRARVQPSRRRPDGRSSGRRRHFGGRPEYMDHGGGGGLHGARAVRLHWTPAMRLKTANGA